MSRRVFATAIITASTPSTRRRLDGVEYPTHWLIVNRRAMLGKDVTMPHVSNSYFSARALVNYPERRKQLPPTDHYKQRFLDVTSRARIKVATSA